MIAVQNQKLEALAKTIQVIYNNQLELVKSSDRLDEQFAVLTRLSIVRLNDLLIRVGVEDLVTYDQVNEMFMEWAAFKSRPDFRDHMQAWFMGQDLSELPPAPEPVKEEDVVSASALGEDADEFGGDYESQSDLGDAESSEGEPENEARHESAPVPEVQNQNNATA